MEPSSIIPVLLGVSGSLGIFLAIRSRQKGGQKKVDELFEHLEGIGVKASILEQNNKPEKAIRKRFWAHKPVGTIKPADRNVDSINVIGVATQYGVNYYLDYLVKTSTFPGGKKKTKMVRKKTSAFRGKLVGIEWRGDDSLARRLNYNYQLKDKLLQADLSTLKGGIVIYPEPKYEHIRIRTNYFLPTLELFEVIAIIASHVRSEF